MPEAGIAIGSNLGDRAANVREAIQRLQQLSVPERSVLVSSVFQTEPRFCPADSPLFLNAVVEIEWDGEPLDLLEITRGIERELGRSQGGERNSPREIDLDLLYFGDRLMEEQELTLPHPRLVERRFVLEPLAEIRPDLILPGMTQTIGWLLAHLESDEPPLEPIDVGWK